MKSPSVGVFYRIIAAIGSESRGGKANLLEADEHEPQSDQTSLKIPIPDKQTVRDLLDIVGKLFG